MNLRPTRAWPRTVRPLAAAAFLLTAATAPSLHAQGTLVAPNNLRTVEGDTSNFLPFFPGGSGATGTTPTPVRLQQVFGATEFAGLPAGGGTITQIAFRTDASSGSTFAQTITSIQLDLALTSRAPDALSLTFADNILAGSDTVVFARGALTLASLDQGPTNGPKAFDIVINFTTPFFYDPTKGNLLLDVRNFSGAGVAGSPATQPLFDATERDGDGVSRISAFGNANATTADVDGVDSLGLVTRFTVVPEPGTTVIFLGLGTALGLAGARRRRVQTTPSVR